MINGKPAPNGRYTYIIKVEAPNEKTRAFGVGTSRIGPSPISLQFSAASVNPGGRIDATVSVKDDNGKPQANILVRVAAKAVPRSGGHDHTGGRPTGEFLNSSGRVVGTLSEDTDGVIRTYNLKTGKDGTAKITYQASAFGGEERIKASLVSNPSTSVFKDLIVKISGLQALPSGTGYVLDGRTSNHSSNHYGTASVVRALPNIATEYRKIYPNAVLYYNDMSLIYGGLFDIYGNWDIPHELHRLGRNVDMPVGNKNLKLIIQRYHGSPAVHSAGTSNEHWHVTF